VSERAPLSERLAALRDELLDVAATDDRAPPCAELFDTIVRLLAQRDRPIEEIEVALHDALSLRLAWGDSERAVLADAAAVTQRVFAAARRVTEDAGEEIELAVAAGEAGAALGRVLTLAALARIARERAGHVREELAQERLRAALERQKRELVELEDELTRRKARLPT
jgi:hypothetical protein